MKSAPQSWRNVVPACRTFTLDPTTSTIGSTSMPDGRKMDERMTTGALRDPSKCEVCLP